jgi:hypothetical protein
VKIKMTIGGGDVEMKRRCEMGRQVEVSLEGFGRKNLSAVLEPQEIKGKSAEEIVQMMVNKEWGPEEQRILEGIKGEMGASGGYSTYVGTLKDIDQPVEYQPVRLEETATRYVYDTGDPQEHLRIRVLGNHEVGNS